MNLFGFLDDIGNRSERLIANYKDQTMEVDTCRCSDGRQPYETGIKHPAFSTDEFPWIIVEAYDTPQEAQAGHDRWVATMTAEPLPDVLVDCRNAEMAATFLSAEELTFPRRTEAAK